MESGHELEEVSFLFLTSLLDTTVAALYFSDNSVPAILPEMDALLGDPFVTKRKELPHVLEFLCQPGGDSLCGWTSNGKQCWLQHVWGPHSKSRKTSLLKEWT